MVKRACRVFFSHYEKDEGREEYIVLPKNQIEEAKLVLEAEGFLVDGNSNYSDYLFQGTRVKTQNSSGGGFRTPYDLGIFSETAEGLEEVVRTLNLKEIESVSQE